MVFPKEALMNKPLLLLLLIMANPSQATDTSKKLTQDEEYKLKVQKEKDNQEYRLAILKIAGTLSIMIVSALINIYLKNKDK